jgi:hypothetical protein
MKIFVECRDASIIGFGSMEKMYCNPIIIKPPGMVFLWTPGWETNDKIN